MASAANDSAECAFRRARDLLRSEGALSARQLEELDVLLAEVSGTDFMALTSDPSLARSFNQYCRYIRMRAFPSMMFLAVLFVVSAIGGSLLAAG